jgi:hypothetical protein
VFLWFRIVILSFFSSQGWESWDIAHRPLIPERMPTLVDDDLLFEDGHSPPDRRREPVAAGSARPAAARRRLAGVDMGLRRIRVTGKGGKERVVPVDGAFFAELAAYLREERPPGCRAPECFVVLRGPTAGQPLTEAGLRRIFRTHRAASGALRVRPHRLRHTYGTELAPGCRCRH